MWELAMQNSKYYTPCEVARPERTAGEVSQRRRRRIELVGRDWYTKLDRQKGRGSRLARNRVCPGVSKAEDPATGLTHPILLAGHMSEPDVLPT